MNRFTDVMNQISNSQTNDGAMPRRDFLKLSAVTVGALGAGQSIEPSISGATPAAQTVSRGGFEGSYAGEKLNRVAFPLGGIGAGMLCLEGSGALSHFSLRHKPEVFNEPCVFAAISIKGSPDKARVLEGPVPGWKLFGAPGTGNGAGGASYGLPRYRRAEFKTRFPFATITLSDERLPLAVEITGWSPFEAGDADSSSFPFAGLEYRFHNVSDQPVSAVFSFNARNFMSVNRNDHAVRSTTGGFICGAAARRTNHGMKARFAPPLANLRRA